MSGINIGILAVQGDVAENILATKMAIEDLGMEGIVTEVKTPEQIADLDGLVIPGGESTVIGTLSLVYGSLKKIKEKIGISKFPGVFIRAPSIIETGKNVEVLSKFNEKIIAVKQGNILGTSFHP